MSISLSSVFLFRKNQLNPPGVELGFPEGELERSTVERVYVCCIEGMFSGVVD